MATNEETAVQKATPSAAPKKATKVKKISSYSKMKEVIQQAANKKKIVVVKKAPTKTKKPVATPAVVDAITQKGASQPHTIIHPDAPWPFKKP